MYYTYVLYSEIKDRYYIGYTSDLEKRLKYHLGGKVRSTRIADDWRIVHKEFFETKREAWLRERRIKSYKRGVAFKSLIHGEVA